MNSASLTTIFIHLCSIWSIFYDPSFFASRFLLPLFCLKYYRSPLSSYSISTSILSSCKSMNFFNCKRNCYAISYKYLRETALKSDIILISNIFILSINPLAILLSRNSCKLHHSLDRLDIKKVLNFYASLGCSIYSNTESFSRLNNSFRQHFF